MSWRHLSLKDISKVIAGQSPKGMYYNSEGSGLPFYQGKKNFTQKFLGKPEKWTTKVTKEAFKGDILMSVRAPVGPVNIATEKVCIGRGLAAIRVNMDIDLDYVYNYLILNESKINGNEGAVFNSINKNQIESIPIPIPSLSEQKQIVETLDKAFEKIDKAIANAEQNLQNAKELFESYLQNVFENKGDDWEEKTLGKVAEVTYGFTGKAYEEGDYRYVRITDIDDNGELDKANKKYLKSSEEGLNFLLNDNDIVMARTGATFAKLLLYKDLEPSIFASYLIRIDFFEDIENEFYWYFSKSRGYWEQAENLSSGAAQPHFNGKALKQIVFSYPKSLQKQKSLISEFKALQNQTKKLEAIYTQKIADLEEMKKAILEKAFKGELISAA